MTAILGKDANDKSVTIDKAERREGLYIIGSSGTGKSTLLTSLIQQDIRDNIGVCVADPHGDLIQRTIELMPPEKYKDVILLDVANPLYVFGLNIFHCENPQDLFAVENVISGVMHILDKVYNISNLTPQMNQYFLNITQTLLYNAPLSILDVPRLFSDKKFRLKLASNVPNTQVRWFWNDFFENRAKFRRDDEMSAVSNKLDDFFRPALKTIFGQEITTINMREIMDDPAGKILLVKMNARWESITKILGSVIVSQILDAAYSRSDMPIKKRRQFHLYADEFQWFASQDFSTLFSEARKYGIGLTIAHQTLEQVDPHIIATCKQAKTIISFRVSGENAESLSTQFNTTPPEPKMEEVGRRKKQTPASNVIEALLNRGSHSNTIINNFIDTKLRPMAGRSRYIDVSINKFLFAVNSGNKDTIPDIQTMIHLCYPNPTLLKDCLEDFAITQLSFSDLWLHEDEAVRKFHELVRERVARYLTQSLDAALQHIIEYGQYTNKYDWYRIIETEIETCQIPDENYIGPGKNFLTVVIPDQRYKFYDLANFDQEVQTQFAQHIAAYNALCLLIKDVVEALYTNPILSDSGEEEVIYRPGQQQTYADKQAEIANMLTRLPNMTAYTRVAGQEHTITIEQINRGMNRQALSDVIADITELNVGDGYIRSRKEVEAEIEARQHPDDSPQPPSPDGSPTEPPKKPDNGSASRANRPSTPLPTPRKRKLGS